MPEPKIARKSPYPVDVEAGKTYYWCQCGESQNQPFCDGSHAGSPFAPLPYTAESTGKVFFCGCKRTKTSPKCDGTHRQL